MAKLAKFVLLPAFALLVTLTLPAQNAELHVVCSNGFHGAMEKLLPRAERAAGVKVNIEYGASRNLKQSLDQGQPFDLLVVIPQVIDELIKEGKVAAGTKTDLAQSNIGVAVRAGRPKPDVSTAQAIKQTLLAAKSIGYVKVGAGTPAFLDMFQKLGITDALRDKTVYQAGAGESMTNLAAGNIDIALALVSEVVHVPGVQLAGPVPAEFQRPVVMTAAIASATKNRQACERFIRALTGPSAAAPIRDAGMEPAASSK
jgi:molybdate transport system substrate-binding protein